MTAQTAASDDSRAISPVIGIALMLAITVIAAAIMGVFIFDLADPVQQESQAGVDIDIADGAETVTVEVLSMGNAEHVEINGTLEGDVAGGTEAGTDVDDVELEVGDRAVLDRSDGLESDSGRVVAIAVRDSGETETVVLTREYDFG